MESLRPAHPRPVLLRKRRVLRYIDVTQGGAVKFDRILLPPSALVITGVKVSGRPIETETVDITALQYRFGAVAAADLSPVQLAALTVGTYMDTQPTWVASAPTDSGKYLYYAHPAQLNDPEFVFMGFRGGFLDRGTLVLSTPSGQQTYRIWRSTNANLGNGVSVQSIH